MKTLYSALAIATMSYFSVGCASTEVADVSDVNQKKIHQHYSVDIEEGSQATCEAAFRFGGPTGTTLQLGGETSVTMNDERMDGEDKFLRGMVYDIHVSGDTKDFSFKFTDADANVYTNSVHLESISIERLPETLHGDQDVIVRWTGAPVGPDETVTIEVRDSESAFYTSVGSTSTMGSSEVTISGRDVADLYNGRGEIRFSRDIRKELAEAADEGGDLVATYTSSNTSVTIEGGRTPQNN